MDEYEMRCGWDDQDIGCPKPFGGIKAILIQPMSLFPKGWSDSQHLTQAEPFLQIGDAMTSKEGDKIQFGNDTTYIKLIND